MNKNREERKERDAVTAAAVIAGLTPETRPCVRCGAGVVMLGGLSAFWQPLCEPCQQIAQDESDIKIRGALKSEADEKWKALCPPGFQEAIDQAKLKCSPEAYSKVMAWQYGKHGLVLHGPTGQGKTRCAWAILRREHDAGRAVRSLNVTDLSFHLPALYAAGADHVDKWLTGLCKCDLLLMDDVFKAVLNERTEAFIYAVVSYRSEYQLPTITTLNDTGDTLKERLTEDRAAPLLRRVKEFAQGVSFA